MLLIHTLTHQRQLAALQGTNQLVRSNRGLGVLLRDTSTRPGWDRTGNPPTARRLLYLLSHIAPLAVHTSLSLSPSFPPSLSLSVSLSLPLSLPPSISLSVSLSLPLPPSFPPSLSLSLFLSLSLSPSLPLYLSLCFSLPPSPSPSLPHCPSLSISLSRTCMHAHSSVYNYIT